MNRFEEVLGLYHETLEGGARRYDLSSARDMLIAAAAVRGQLELISPDWESYVELTPE